ncbi:MAG: NmrA family NAD(P)-binding protein [Pseudonocardiaceae bacterium]
MFIVMGANGKTGGAVARALLAAAHPVRVVLRSIHNADRWRAAGVEVAVADIHDAESLIAAFRGAQAAYVLNPLDYHVDDLFEQGRLVADAYRMALSSTGVRAVALSSIGAQHAEGTGNILTTNLLESALAPLGASFVRAGNFMTNWLSNLPAIRSGLLPSFFCPLDRAVPNVAVQDIAAVVVRELLGAGSRTVELAGPVDYTPNQVAEAFATALGHPVRAEVIAREQWSEVLTGNVGLPGAAVGSWMEMWQAFNSGHVCFEGTPERGSVTFEEFAATAVTETTQEVQA